MAVRFSLLPLDRRAGVLADLFAVFYRICSLGRLNLLFVFLTGSILSASIPQAGFDVQQWPPPWITTNHPTWAMVLSIALFFVSYFLLFWAFKNFKRLRAPISICLATTLLLACFCLLSRETLFLKAVCVGLFVAFVRNFWSMAFQLSEVDLLAKKPFMDHLGTLSSPWHVGWGSQNIMRGYSDYTNSLGADAIQLSRLRSAGVKLIIYAVVLKYGADLFYDFFFSQSIKIGSVQLAGLSPLLGIELSAKNFINLSLPISYAWVYMLARCAHFILSLAAFTNVAVSIARMCGLSARRHVFHPLRATSFNNFLNRTYYYYIATILRFFYFPLWGHLRLIRQRTARLFLTTYLTIFIGGMITTLLHYLPFDVASDFFYVQTAFLFRTPYFLLLALISGGSAVLPSVLPNHILVRLTRGPFYFVLYALCFALQIRDGSFDLEPRLKAFAHLFGFC